eukprot:TRINITY_DN227_c5_g2_i1.p1 TRINITY_DN227_c5_g2~~TRINITY_DN227_c5_g2_i1.p1  ORF type:complete len:610 (+),score=211.82 TRINITY_DN227_c5_g2_i1:90-1919(+)
MKMKMSSSKGALNYCFGCGASESACRVCQAVEGMAAGESREKAEKLLAAALGTQTNVALPDCFKFLRSVGLRKHLYSQAPFTMFDGDTAYERCPVKILAPQDFAQSWRQWLLKLCHRSRSDIGAAKLLEVCIALSRARQTHGDERPRAVAAQQAQNSPMWQEVAYQEDLITKVANGMEKLRSLHATGKIDADKLAKLLTEKHVKIAAINDTIAGLKSTPEYVRAEQVISCYKRHLHVSGIALLHANKRRVIAALDNDFNLTAPSPEFEEISTSPASSAADSDGTEVLEMDDVEVAPVPAANKTNLTRLPMNLGPLVEDEAVRVVEAMYGIRDDPRIPRVPVSSPADDEEEEVRVLRNVCFRKLKVPSGLTTEFDIMVVRCKKGYDTNFANRKGASKFFRCSGAYRKVAKEHAEELKSESDGTDTGPSSPATKKKKMITNETPMKMVSRIEAWYEVKGNCYDVFNSCTTLHKTQTFFSALPKDEILVFEDYVWPAATFASLGASPTSFVTLTPEASASQGSVTLPNIAAPRLLPITILQHVLDKCFEEPSVAALEEDFSYTEGLFKSLRQVLGSAVDSIERVIETASAGRIYFMEDPFAEPFGAAYKAAN